MGLEAMVNEGVRRAYTHPDNPLRASIVDDPVGARRNTGDNTLANVYVDLVPGDTVEVKLAAKGGGSEAKATFAVLNPSDDLAEWVLEQVPGMGAGWCPPGILGIGIGGSAEEVRHWRPGATPRTCASSTCSPAASGCRKLSGSVHLLRRPCGPGA